jgi:hypothetical protein
MCYANNSFGYKAVIRDWRACRARFGKGLTFRLVRLPKCDGVGDGFGEGKFGQGAKERD